MKTYREGEFLFAHFMNSKRRLDFAYLGKIIDKVHLQEVGYTSATTGRGDHEVHKGHVVVLGGGKKMQDELWLE
jgi:hypothetical protein